MSLGLLVGRFGNIVRDHIPIQPDFIPDDPFPDQLKRLRGEFIHHLIPLVLLSRVDGDYVATEREAILAHCLALAAKSRIDVEDTERAALVAYIAEFQPSFAQLEPALKNIENESVDSVAALIAAARAVVDADGKRRTSELQLLAELEHELEEFSVSSS